MSHPAGRRSTPGGAQWALGRRRNKIVLVWQQPTDDGTLTGELVWDDPADVPADVDFATHVDRAVLVARARGTAYRVGEGSRTRRVELRAGHRLYVHHFWGPPTWWTPRFGVEGCRSRVGLRAGWLRHATTIHLEHHSHKTGGHAPADLRLLLATLAAALLALLAVGNRRTHRT